MYHILERKNKYPIWYNSSSLRELKEKYTIMKRFDNYGNYADKHTFALPGTLIDHDKNQLST